MEQVEQKMKLLRLEPTTIDLLNAEFAGIPDKYQNFFNSTHEGYGVLMEEVKELEDEIFFGEKRAKELFKNDLDKNSAKLEAKKLHKDRIRLEAIQVAAMAIRIAQELTD
jgi:hypothetical protein